MNGCRWMTSQYIMYLSYERENQQINDNVELVWEREKETNREIRARPTSSWIIFTFKFAVRELKRINCSTAGLKYHVPTKTKAN